MSISLTTLVQKFLDLHHQQHQHLYEHDVHAGGAEKEFVTNNNNNNSSNNNILSSSSNNNSNNSSNSNSNETYGFKTVSRIPRTKIELHLHLDGSIRTSTILDLAK